MKTIRDIDNVFGLVSLLKMGGPLTFAGFCISFADNVQTYQLSENTREKYGQPGIRTFYGFTFRKCYYTVRNFLKLE